MRPYRAPERATSDDTVVLRRPAPRRRWPVACAGLFAVAVAVGGGIWWDHNLTAPSPATSLPLATQAEIEADEPAETHWFRFADNPRILIADFPTLAAQARMFNRLAAYAEVAGAPHDRLLSDAELARTITAAGADGDSYYYGHDYDSDTIRHFFALADRDGVRLNADEERLRQIARAQGLLAADADQAIITLPKRGADHFVDAPFRHAILTHELSHGEFFTDPGYAAYARLFWRSALNEADRARFVHFLAEGHYDTSITDLMINETQAYLMFTPDPRLFSASALGLSAAALAALRHRYREDMPAGWLRERAVQ